jgi:hypothetical protein
MQTTTPYLFWDTCPTPEHVKDYMETYNYGMDAEDNINENEAFTMLCADYDHWEMEWDYLIDNFTELLNKINPNGSTWFATGHDMGWRKLEGTKTFKAKDAEEFLNELLPDCEKTFYIYKSGNQIAIKCSHHDAPMGEMYYIKPCKECTHCGEPVEHKYWRICEYCRN